MAKVGIIFLGYYFGISTSVIQTASSLAAHGFDVDIFLDATNATEAPPVAFESPNVRIIVGQKSTTTGSINDKNKWAQKYMPDLIWTLWCNIKRPLRPFYYWMQLLLNKNYRAEDYLRDYAAEWQPYFALLCSKVAAADYTALIGVEATGLIAASYAREKARCPQTALIYYNMELIQDSLFMPRAFRLRKQLEAMYARQCIFTVIADENRGSIFRKSTGVAKSKLRYLTVSTGGPAVCEKGRYFRELFGLPDNITIVVYSGNIRPWAMCKEIVQSVPSWPLDCVLVMHTWRSDFSTDKYCQELLKLADRTRVFFSTVPVPAVKFPEVLSSADVGIAIYEPIDENFTEIGSSSNKLAQYAQVGLPIICSDFPSIRRVVDRYKSGVCVDKPHDIGRALSVIISDYSKFRQGAFESYRRHYDFNVSFEPLLEEFIKMSQSRAC